MEYSYISHVLRKSNFVGIKSYAYSEKVLSYNENVGISLKHKEMWNYVKNKLPLAVLNKIKEISNENEQVYKDLM